MHKKRATMKKGIGTFILDDANFKQKLVFVISYDNFSLSIKVCQINLAQSPAIIVENSNAFSYTTF